MGGVGLGTGKIFSGKVSNFIKLGGPYAPTAWQTPAPIKPVTDPPDAPAAAPVSPPVTAPGRLPTRPPPTVHYRLKERSLRLVDC